METTVEIEVGKLYINKSSKAVCEVVCLLHYNNSPMVGIRYLDEQVTRGSFESAFHQNFEMMGDGNQPMRSFDILVDDTPELEVRCRSCKRYFFCSPLTHEGMTYCYHDNSDPFYPNMTISCECGSFECIQCEEELEERKAS